MYEQDQDNWNQPYKKLKAIEEQKQGNDFLDLYTKLYTTKFKTEPIFNGPYEGLNLSQTISKQLGNKAFELLTHFFEMREEWFIKQGYSLDCFKKSLSQVNASYGNRQKTKKVNETMLVLTVYCDSCGLRHNSVLPLSQAVDHTIYCNTCKINYSSRYFGNDKTMTKEEYEERVAIREES